MEGPIYLRGFDRATAERTVRLFMRRYQPPIECSHRWSKPLRNLAGVRGLTYRRCTEPACAMVVGLLQ